MGVTSKSAPGPAVLHKRVIEILVMSNGRPSERESEMVAPAKLP